MMHSSKARLLIFGGTFDPFHEGHRSILTQVMAAVPSAGALVVPLNIPNHRHQPIASVIDRFKMAKLGIAGIKNTAVSDCEMDRGGISYTIDTLDTLAHQYSESLWFIIGSDAAATIPLWHRADELIARGNFVVVNREGHTTCTEDVLCNMGFDNEHFICLTVQSPSIMATDIRSRLEQGNSTIGLLHPAVAQYIADHGLYSPYETETVPALR